jgi:hypothetical protein
VTAQSGGCPQCGSPRQGELRFCANCGFDYWKAAEQNPLSTTTAGSALTTPTSDGVKDASDKKNRRIGCIALGVIAVIIFAIIGSLMGDPDDEAAETTPTPESPSSAPQSSAADVSGSAAPTVAEPTVPPSPVASLEPEPALAAIDLSGTGNAVPRFEIPADSAAVADIAHTGASNFAVWAVNEGGEQTDLLVNVIGNYAGTVLFDESAGSHTVAFDVEAGGAWTITIKPVTEAFRWDGTETLTGTGDHVAILDPASSGLKSMTLTHAGDGNFAVWAYGPATDLLVNEIGSYSGEVLLPDGTFLFEITANGAWTLSPPQ